MKYPKGLVGYFVEYCGSKPLHNYMFIVFTSNSQMSKQFSRKNITIPFLQSAEKLMVFHYSTTVKIF